MSATEVSRVPPKSVYRGSSGKSPPMALQDAREGVRPDTEASLLRRVERRAAVDAGLSDNYICALTTITPEHPNGHDELYLADTPEVRGAQPGASDGRAGEEAHGRDAGIAPPCVCARISSASFVVV